MARVLLLNANRVGIGTYHRALNFGRALAYAGHIVTMMTVSQTKRWCGEKLWDPSGLSVIHGPNLLDEILPWHASGPLDIAGRVYECLTQRWDLVWAFEYQPNVSIPTYISRFALQRPYISDWCDWHAGASYHFGGRAWAHRVDRIFEEAIRHPAKVVTVINDVLMRRAHEIGIPNSRVVKLLEGVDTSHMVPMDRMEARRRAGIDWRGWLVASIKDSPRGHALLVEAVASLRRKKIDVGLLIIGRAPGLADTVAKEFGILDSVILPGRVSDELMPAFLGSADVLALPLEDNLVNRGRWPHKLGDMIACGRPVLTTRAGEFPELLADSGCVCACEYSAPGFASGIETLLGNSADRDLLAAEGRHFAEQVLDWKLLYPSVASVAERALR